MKKILLCFAFLLFLQNLYITSDETKISYKNKLEDFYLALSGIIMENNNSSHTELKVSLLDEKGKDSSKYLLNKDWGIKNHYTCVKMIEWLFNEGHSAKLKNFLVYAKNYTYIINIIKKLNLTTQETRRLVFVYEFLQYFNEKEMLYGWDIGRVVSVSRWGYNAGYLSEEETWAFIKKAGKKLISIFDNWEDYGANYVLGRLFWKAAFDDYSSLQYKTALLYYTVLDDDIGIWKKVSWPREKKTKRKYDYIEKYQNIAQFYIAIKKDDVESLKKIKKINKKYYIDSVNHFDWPPVFTSIVYKSNEVAKFLINNNFDINAENPNNDRTPLMQALYDNNKEIINLLIKNKVNLNVIDDEKWTSLMFAIRYSKPEIIKNLINEGSNINAINAKGWTPLMFSIRYSTAEISKIILNQNPDINTRNKNGWNALSFALRYNKPEISNIILKLDPEVNIADNNGWTPLMLALRYCSPEIAEKVLNAGAEVNTKNKSDWTPLMHAFRYSTTEIAEKILDAGAKVNTKNKNDWTPLIFAIRYSTNKIIERLLNSNADINAKTKDGWTPLHFAAYKSNLIIAEKLIQLGCNPNALNNKGKKPIDLIKDDSTKKMWNNLVKKSKL